MENREFLITYYRKDADVEDIRRFRTLKHLSDWFNSNIEPIVIIGIQEIPGDPWYDKYFKKGESKWQELEDQNGYSRMLSLTVL